MAEAARIEFSQEESLTRPLLASELSTDLLVRARAARFVGSLAMTSTVELVDNKPLHSLMDGIQLAAQGDQEAYELVKANVASDVIERTLKAGFITSKSRMEIDEDGLLFQHGQSYRSVQANSLRQSQKHNVMRARTEAENRNGFRLENLAMSGVLDKYSFVVFSLAENLPDCGFYTSNMSCSIQVTKKEKDGLETESAFVAGIDETGKAHDKASVAQIYANLTGVDISSKTPAEIIDMPLLIPNELIPNGVIDVVKLYDDYAGGTFFGQNKPRLDYLEYRRTCSSREQNYLSVSLKIIRQLLAEAKEFKTPLQATKRLNRLSQDFTLEMALYDDSIDPHVFGKLAANHIVRARKASSNGLISEVRHEMTRAIAVAISSSCATPGGLLSQLTNELGDSSDSDGQSDKFGSLSFFCPNGHLNHRPRNTLISKCRDCKVSVKC